MWTLTASVILATGNWCATRNPRISPAFWDEEAHIEQGGIRRSFLIHPPRRTSPGDRLPVVIVLHGGGGTGLGMLNVTMGRFQELAERRGFVAVYPDGPEKAWNDGRRDVLSPEREGMDDVAFFRSMIEYVILHYPADRQRIYFTGISNGGLMSYRLACEMPEAIKGIAAVTASLSSDLYPHCHPSAAVDVLIINGTLDPLVPYNGGEIQILRKKRRHVLSSYDTARFWADAARCGREPVAGFLPDVDPSDGTRVGTLTYVRCAEDRRVVLYSVEGGGHTWPGGWQYLPETFIGKTSRDFFAADAIVDFFLGSG